MSIGPGFLRMITRPPAWARVLLWFRVRFTRRVVVCDWCYNMGVAERGRLYPDGWAAGLCPGHIDHALRRARELSE